MRKIIGIGETILDIIFKNGQPQRATPGGSVFNGLVTLGRLKKAFSGENDYEVHFISDIGRDSVGDLICHFMERNGISPDYVNRHPESKTAVSLAFLNENNDADYTFYKDYAMKGLTGEFPEITGEDLIIFGSFYALNPILRERMKLFLDSAHKAGATIYYDVNLRKNHEYEIGYLQKTLVENFEYADILRGSEDDFDTLCGKHDPYEVFRRDISSHTSVFIYTAGPGEVILQTPQGVFNFPVPPIETVSTIGAGDNFNAGVMYGLFREGIRKKDVPTMNKSQWERVIGFALKFSAEVCQSYENYISIV